jgi:DNA-binding transcriptional regulator YbjK
MALNADWSPKQLAKRDLIVDAAVDALKQYGVAGCTVRNIAAAGPYTKSVIHYYFADVTEIVNAAYGRLTDAYTAAIEAMVGDTSGSVMAFWSLLASYIEPFEAHGSMARLWFDYISWATDNGYQREAASSVDSIRGMFRRRLAAIDEAKEPAAVPLVRYLLGAIVDLSISTVSLEQIFVDAARICGLRPPRPRQVVVDHDAVCPLCRGDQQAKRPRKISGQMT